MFSQYAMHDQNMAIQQTQNSGVGMCLLLLYYYASFNALLHHTHTANTTNT